MVRKLGIDLGTTNLLICSDNNGVIVDEPAVITIDAKTKKCIAAGLEAREMVGRTPQNMVCIRPLKDGVIADYEATDMMLNYFLKKCNLRGFFKRNVILICHPTKITSVEKNAIRDCAYRAGAKKVYLEEEPKVAALGAGLEIGKASGNMVLDIGGGTTDIAVISLGGSVVSASIKVAGDKFDEAVIRYIKKKHNVIIGERTAEDLKINIGCVYPKMQDTEMDIRGRDLIDGLPKTVTVYSSEMLEAMIEPALMIVDAVHSVLERTPPELAADISDKGIYMTGGGALLDGLDKLLQEKTGINVMIAEDAISCVAKGTGKALDNLDKMDRRF